MTSLGTKINPISLMSDSDSEATEMDDEIIDYDSEATEIEPYDYIVSREPWQGLEDSPKFGDEDYEYDSEKTEIEMDEIALNPNAPAGTTFGDLSRVDSTIFLNEVDSDEEFDKETKFWEYMYKDPEKSAIEKIYQKKRPKLLSLPMPEGKKYSFKIYF